MWNQISAWFKKSETIVVARVQMAIGAVMLAITQITDPLVKIINMVDSYLSAIPALQGAVNGMFSAKALPFYVILNGIVTEWARRRRDPGLGQ